MGNIPQTIGVLTPLKILNLGNNNLNDSLPPKGSTVNIYLHLVFHFFFYMLKVGLSINVHY